MELRTLRRVGDARWRDVSGLALARGAALTPDGL
jgi:hypothetical protein